MGFKQRLAKWLLGGNTIKSYSSIGGIPVYGTINQQSNIDKYLTLDDVYSIVKFRARTTAMIPLRVYKVKNQGKLKDYQFATQTKDFSTKGLVKKLLIKSQALEEVDDNNELQILLDKPNPSYSKFEFLEGVYTSPMLSGNTYIFMGKPELGVNAGKPKELHLMPPQFTHPIVAGDFPKSITGYELSINGIKKYKPEDVLHLRYFNPDFNANGCELEGLSPLVALHRTTARGKAENDFMVKGFQNAGAQGIANFEDLDPNDGTTTEALGKMKQDFYRDSSGTNNAQKSIFHAGKSSFTQIGLGPVEMKVIESQKLTFKKTCNAFFVSDILFNSDSASTESNVKEATTRMYTNACLPDAYAFRDLLNQKLTPLFNKGGVTYFIDVDITGISELQDDMKAMAEIFNTLPIMNPAWISEAFGYGVENPEMDKIYVKTGYTLLEDLNVNDLSLTEDYKP